MKRSLICSLLAINLITCAATCHAAENTQKYLEGRLAATDKRYASFVLALELLSNRNAKTIVETGTARFGDQNFAGDGGSTIIFGNWANDNNAEFHSVDISPTAVESAKNATKPFAAHCECHCGDSIQFLAEYPKSIDFLYLDSYDFDENNPAPSQEHHLKEITAVYSKLHKNSIVMIDDCALPHGGKGKLIIEFLKNKGWKTEFNGYQVIMSQV